jgi:pseudomonalisin
MAAQLFDQNTGNVILMTKPDLEILWSTGTGNSSASVLTLHEDGNLVLLSDSGLEIWSSNTSGSNASILVVQDNCNMNLYQTAPMESVVWSTTTPFCITAHIVMHSHDDVGWLLT